MRRITPILIAIISASLTQMPVQAEPSIFSKAGFRVGMDVESEVDLNSYELFTNTDWGWSGDWGDHFHLDLNIETAFGILDGEGETIAYGRIAPMVVIRRNNFPVALSISSGPSLYSDSSFGDYDMGSQFHFTTSLGLEWDLGDSWTVGCRLQHTSNAHLNDVNPGLDMYAVSAALRF